MKTPGFLEVHFYSFSTVPEQVLSSSRTFQEPEDPQKAVLSEEVMERMSAGGPWMLPTCLVSGSRDVLEGLV